ncbi:MAG TPA: MXAN_6640 family putative metalloprotease, partial [Ignavibacteriales bacterium]|nr:MXAN_6640 family putative metalloprotease [Ignavibacteriales bacterium]
MRKRLLFILFICAAVEALPQSGNARLDSIFNVYASSHGRSLEGTLPSVAAEAVSGEPVKCGLPLSAELQANYDALSLEQKQLLSKILIAPSLHTFVISPSGIFKIHYDTLGANAPNYNSALTVHANAMLAAEAFDSSYVYEVGYLGYPPPPMEGVYDVYIENVDNQFYGETVTYKRYTSTTSYTYIRIDNDYVSTYTKGVVALNVTAAHELHHSIELGNYTSVFDAADIFFFELTATSMEEFVYDDCNDYYNYLASYFHNPDRNFIKNTGYNLCIWNIYLRQKYGEAGFDIIKSQWDEMAKGRRAMDAIQESLLAASSSFQKEYAEFSVWNYFTKHRAIAGRY